MDKYMQDICDCFVPSKRIPLVAPTTLFDMQGSNFAPEWHDTPFEIAIECRLIKTSPMDKVKRPRAERYAAKFLNESEIIDLFDAVEGHKLELGVILGGYYGLRRGEVVGSASRLLTFSRTLSPLTIRLLWLMLEVKSR